jgi:hypothetical protein
LYLSFMYTRPHKLFTATSSTTNHLLPLKFSSKKASEYSRVIPLEPHKALGFEKNSKVAKNDHHRKTFITFDICIQMLWNFAVYLYCLTRILTVVITFVIYVQVKAHIFTNGRLFYCTLVNKSSKSYDIPLKRFFFETRIKLSSSYKKEQVALTTKKLV